MVTNASTSVTKKVNKLIKSSKKKANNFIDKFFSKIIKLSSKASLLTDDTHKSLEHLCFVNKSI